MKTHRDRAGGPSGRREVAGDAVHRQNFPTPSDGLPARPERRLTGAFGPFGAQLGGVAHGSRCPASPRRTLLTENPGKPSL
jgi:hypothetical protein